MYIYVYIYIYIWVASAFLFGLHHVRQAQGETKLRNDVFFFSRTYQIGAYKNNKSAKAALGVISVGLVTVLISSKRDGTILNASLFFKKGLRIHPESPYFHGVTVKWEAGRPAKGNEL